MRGHNNRETKTMAERKIALLFGMEDTFPWALIEEINGRNAGVEAMPAQIGAIKDTDEARYDVILDRISHEVPFYRTWLKAAAAKGATVVSSPFWAAADDKFFNNIVAEKLGVAVPKTVLLPHKQRPASTEEKSFRNMQLVDWDDVFAYLGFPIFMKPAYGGGWKDVYKIDNAEEFFRAYDQTRDLTMMAQEAIEFTEYYRCYVLGRSRVRIMRYDPKVPFHERYVRNAPETEPGLLARIERDCLKLCEALGYDMNTVEFAVRDGVPVAIDFMNSAPDADKFSVGDENFAWVVKNMADVLIDRAKSPRAFEITGNWPGVMRPTASASSSSGAPPAATPTPKKNASRAAAPRKSTTPRPRPKS
jgi:glutathione synthase/RimK-type ligase-like ATP-grasp enzyme